MFTINPTLAEDSIFIDKLSISQIRISKDSNYPWIILVPEIINTKNQTITEITDLNWNQQLELLKEINFISQFLQKNYRPTKLNIANLGNIVSQLHIHLIARFEDDKSFPKPVWGFLPTEKYKNDDLLKITEQLKNFIANYKWFFDESQNIINKLLYRSTYRGCKETDFLIGNFAKEMLIKMSAIELLNFDLFLNEEDVEIYDWVLGKSTSPRQYSELIEKISSFYNLKK
jgi:diadenosine tetraphosphate (Ap4A) HIT family hydrolase/succinate dehydrogenase flavin-adding protein (antitoxin of CptAB toxin-antitoxin module)